MENGKGTKKGTWTNIVQNAREVANSIWVYLGDKEKVELEYIFSYISELNGTKEISGFETTDRHGQCKYCWRYVPVIGKGKWPKCGSHSAGSRDPSIRKIMKLKDDIHDICAKVLHNIFIDPGTLAVTVDKVACPHLAKLMDYEPRTRQAMCKFLDIHVEIETYELTWAMATYEAWHQAHAGVVANIPKAARDAVVEIPDALWARRNKTEGASLF